MNFRLRNVGLEIAFTTKLREMMKCTKDFVSNWSDSKISYWNVQEVMGSMKDKFGCNCSRRKNLQLWEFWGKKLGFEEKSGYGLKIYIDDKFGDIVFLSLFNFLRNLGDVILFILPILGSNSIWGWDFLKLLGFVIEITNWFMK
jgi:hypothetical protein